MTAEQLAKVKMQRKRSERKALHKSMGFYSSIIMHPDLAERLLRHESYQMLESASTKIQNQPHHNERNRYLSLPLTILGPENQAIVQRRARRHHFSVRKGVHDDGQPWLVHSWFQLGFDSLSLASPPSPPHSQPPAKIKRRAITAMP